MTAHPTVRRHSVQILAALGWLCTATSMAQVCTREFAPVCGQVTGAMTTQTYPNRCMLKAAQAQHLFDGECTHTTHQGPPQAPPSIPPTLPGSTVDAHGCIPSAGYLWNPELARCIRPWMTSVVTLQVAAQRRSCTALVEMQCLQVREIESGVPPQKWQALFTEIEGFQHIPGKRYTLRVRKDRVETPPADAPDTRYTLVKVLP